jgi:predicted molibdopterin-dependent oxidoreductase YjgC
MLLGHPLIEAAANLLTIGAADPAAKIPEYKECAVKVVKT